MIAAALTLRAVALAISGMARTEAAASSIAIFEKAARDVDGIENRACAARRVGRIPH